MRFLIFLLFINVAVAGDLRVEYWTKKPIKYVVPVGERVQIFMDKDVLAEFPLGRNFIEIESASQSLYLKAIKEFKPQILKIIEADTNKTYFIDLSAAEKAETQSLRIKNVEEEVEAEEAFNSLRTNVDPRVSLIRHASQTLYPYSNRLPETGNIAGFSVQKKEAQRFINDIPVKATPLASWKGYGLYVTAVKLENTSSFSIVIDPRKNIRGRWVAISFQHPIMKQAFNPHIQQSELRPSSLVKLSPSHESESVTTAYVISQAPFWESLSL